MSAAFRGGRGYAALQWFWPVVRGWELPVVGTVWRIVFASRLYPSSAIPKFSSNRSFAPLRYKFGCSLLTPARRKRNQQEEHMLLRNPRLFPIVGVPFLALVFRISKGPD